VVRKFHPVDLEIIKGEIRALNSPHRAKLMYAMERYQASTTAVDPAVIKSQYPEGILEIRHSNGAYKGRGLFFPESSTKLVLLTVYRKDSARTPAGIVDLAIRRKHMYEKNK
jgi:phage-related protein